MANTKIIIATVPKTDNKLRALNMVPSRKAEILQQMAAATDIRLGLQPTKPVRLDENPGPRKRQRLTHLSPEEKMMRRKLKNRVAAQTARDRKKAQVDGLESNLTVLEAKNKQLQLENAILRKQNEFLVEENKDLKARLGMSTTEEKSLVNLDHGYCMDVTTSPISVNTANTTITTTSTNTTSDSIVTSSEQATMKQEVGVGSPEPAALNAPPQQELARLVFSFLATMLTWSLTMSYLDCSASLTKQHPKESLSLSAEEPLCLVTRKGERNGDQTWWGPQQRSWNPSKN